MVIREAGIMVRGYPLVYSSYHDTGGKDIDVVLRTGLLSGILTFIETAYTKDAIEYIESKNYIIVFKANYIKGEKSPEPEIIISYVILDKMKKLDKFITKNIMPFLEKILKKFIEKYSGKNLSNVSLFEEFKNDLDKIFKIESKSLDEKFKDFFDWALDHLNN